MRTQEQVFDLVFIPFTHLFYFIDGNKKDYKINTNNDDML